jgi:hypothetical protein
VAFFADPNGGRRRRALVRDKAVRAGRQSARTLQRAGRDLRNRSSGLRAQAASLLRRAPALDDVLEQGLRSERG